MNRNYCHACQGDGYWIESDRVSNRTLYGSRLQSPSIVTEYRKVLCNCETARRLRNYETLNWLSIRSGDKIRSLRTKVEMTVTHEVTTDTNYIRATRKGEILHIRIDDWVMLDWYFLSREGD